MNANSKASSSIIPAAGMATRFGGIPKFLLPNGVGDSLLRYHVLMSNAVCGQTVVVVRPEWASLVYKQVGNLHCDILVKETNTMSETIISALEILNGDVVVMHMPDTYIGTHDVLKKILDKAIESNSHILGCWSTREDQKGKLGQVFSKEMQKDFFRISRISDKNPEDVSGTHWGVVALHKNNLRREFWNKDAAHLGKLIENELATNPLFEIHGLALGEGYFDLGTPQELGLFLIESQQG